MRPFLLILIVVLAAPALAVAQTSAPPAGAEARDVVLMLDRGPLHLRFHVSLGGRSLTDRREEYVERLIASLDRDGDGVVSREEARATPLLAARRRERAAAFLASLDSGRSVPKSEIVQSVTRVGGEPVVYRQDGSAAEKDLDVFKALDADGSGGLTPNEMSEAALRILAKDTDRDECVTFEEFSPPPAQPDGTLMQVVGEAEEEGPRPTVADDLRDASEPLLPRRLVSRYDRNRDAHLSAAELAWPAERLAPLDADRDGRLSAAELRRFGETPVDLELAVELTPEAGAPAIAVLSSDGGRVSGTAGDFLRFDVGGTTLTVSHRPHEPIVAAVENAMREFNRMDADGNGYLDAEEASVRTRFERGLFDTVDADADAKVFAEEMERYVRLRTEPSATSCQMNLYDAGRGFFGVLDANGDGRISVREMRASESALSAARASDSGPLTPDDPRRTFHIEFVRGAYQLFGRAESAAPRPATFLRQPTLGPIWFRRMDRNADGDLTWNEFLGPRPVFQRLDADGDGLVDHREAEAAGEAT